MNERFATPAALAELVTAAAAAKVRAKHPLKNPPLGEQVEALVIAIFEAMDKRYGRPA
jgi:hypothetical protein